MTTDKVLMVVGVAIFAVMAVLLRIGTTSLALFISEGVVALGGLGIAAVGQKMRDGR